MMEEKSIWGFGCAFGGGLLSIEEKKSWPWGCCWSTLVPLGVLLLVVVVLLLGLEPKKSSKLLNSVACFGLVGATLGFGDVYSIKSVSSSWGFSRRCLLITCCVVVVVVADDVAPPFKLLGSGIGPFMAHLLSSYFDRIHISILLSLGLLSLRLASQYLKYHSKSALSNPKVWWCLLWLTY